MLSKLGGLWPKLAIGQCNTVETNFVPTCKEYFAVFQLAAVAPGTPGFDRAPLLIKQAR